MRSGLLPLPLPERFWHTTPLHYLPHLLKTGSLYSQDYLAAHSLPISPRRTAAKRDRKLGLSGYVHLSFAAQTPLLAHKRALGYPHVLLAFDAALSESIGAAFVRFNSKSWRHREDFFPITEAAEKVYFWAEWQQGKYPSAALLVPESLPLIPYLAEIQVADERQREWIEGFCEALKLEIPAPLWVQEDSFPPGMEADMTPFRVYGDACREAGLVLPPPNLPFD
jgi:hypothetical protein